LNIYKISKVNNSKLFTDIKKDSNTFHLILRKRVPSSIVGSVFSNGKTVFHHEKTDTFCISHIEGGWMNIYFSKPRDFFLEGDNKKIGVNLFNFMINLVKSKDKDENTGALLEILSGLLYRYIQDTR
jgi:hypothetical protein